MSRGLILPAHAAGKTEIEQRAAQARQVLTIGFVVIVPGVASPVQIQLPNPIPIEGVVPTLVQIAFQEIGKAAGEQIAEKVLASFSNGHMN
jgi:hypothetical protein